jgi:hypothetical protein
MKAQTMRASAGTNNVMTIVTAARYCAAVATVLAVGLGPGLLGDGHAASDAEWSNFKGLVSAAYFSETCRHEAELLDIGRTTDAGFLVAAFAQSVATGTPDARAERRAGSFDARSGSASCGVPSVALINLLRLNGVAAELVLVRMQQESSASFPAFSDKVDGVLVYLPTLGRYVDPAATDLRENATLDRVIKGTAVRAHLIGPAPHADPALAACGHVCVNVYSPRHDPFAVRVVTEAIHVP